MIGSLGIRVSLPQYRFYFPGCVQDPRQQQIEIGPPVHLSLHHSARNTAGGGTPVEIQNLKDLLTNVESQYCEGDGITWLGRIV